MRLGSYRRFTAGFGVRVALNRPGAGPCVGDRPDLAGFDRAIAG